jgi:hypothetical protein
MRHLFGSVLWSTCWVLHPSKIHLTQLREELLTAMSNEPTTIKGAMKSKAWHAAMLDKLGSIRENKTWSLVDLPRGHKAIGLKWVFKLKHDEHGEVVKHKAQLVAKGYVQRQGIDFDEVYAPVVRMESVRIMLILATHLNWSVHHIDVKSSFLNGDLGEEVYVSRPPPDLSLEIRSKKCTSCTRLSMALDKH